MSGLFVALLVPSLLHARVWKVPEDRPAIQDGINAASNGDTVSVWGYGEPPFAYQENVDFGGKSVFLVNRSFLPEQTPGYDSSWEHVIIDARALGRVATLSLTSGWSAATVRFYYTRPAE
jgi:hypothetical protein